MSACGEKYNKIDAQMTQKGLEKISWGGRCRGLVCDVLA